MAHDITFNSSPGFLEIKYTGEITLEEILTAVEGAWELMQRHNFPNVLSDFLDAEINFDLSRILEINGKIAELGIPKSTRSAVVISQEEADSKNMQVRLYEMAAGSEGWPAKMFYDREQAIDWLLI